MRSAAGVFVMLMLVDDGETRFLFGSGPWSWGSDRIGSNRMGLVAIYSICGGFFFFWLQFGLI